MRVPLPVAALRSDSGDERGAVSTKWWTHVEPIARVRAKLI
jgi:hypothetical protein